MQETFGSRLKKYRKACGLTQEQLAEQLNIHERTVSRWERDVSNPDISIFGVLSDILHVSLEELWGLPANKRTENGTFDLVSFGQELAAQRIRLNESQGDLAQAVGVSSDIVSKWERGLISPNIETFIELAKHFDVAPSVLYYAKGKHDPVSGQSDVVIAKKFFNTKNLLIVGACSICLFVALALILTFCIKPPVGGDSPIVSGNQACEHQYISSVTEPTCTAQGFTTFTCTKCGNNYISEYTPKKEHDFGEWIVAQEPTCKAAGSKYRECSACGTKSASEKIEMLPHTYEQSVTQSTCTAQGFTTFICTKCGNNYISEYTPKKEHAFGEWIVTQEPTCKAAGSKYKECSACGTKSASEKIEMLPHTYEQSVTQSTCTAQGFTMFTCTKCGNSYQTNYTALAAHTYERKSVTEPTCTAQGFTTFTCTKCGSSYQTDYTALAAHTYERKSVTQPTCTTQGYTTYCCALCGDSYRSDYTETLPHTESVWEIVREPGCSYLGNQRKRCLVCNITLEMATIDKLPHDYSEHIVPPNGSEAGYMLYTCTVCGNSYRDGYFTDQYDGIEYHCDYSARTCTLYSAEEFTGDKLEIPKTVNGCTVTVIGWSAFSDCITLREVTIPDTVVKIDLYAFYRCALLEKVVIPDSVTFLGDEAFCGCRGLKEATLPKNITRIRYSTFSDCVNLRKIEIPQSVTIIEDLAFHNCPKLPNIVLPDHLFSIGSYAFYDCASLQRIVIPSTVVRIGERAFEGCSALVEVIFCKKTNWTADETALNETELADCKKAADYLTDIYYTKIWLCE